VNRGCRYTSITINVAEILTRIMFRSDASRATQSRAQQHRAFHFVEEAFNAHFFLQRRVTIHAQY
jgi:hypothetical protein